MKMFIIEAVDFGGERKAILRKTVDLVEQAAVDAEARIDSFLEFEDENGYKHVFAITNEKAVATLTKHQIAELLFEK